MGCSTCKSSKKNAAPAKVMQVPVKKGARIGKKVYIRKNA